MPLVEINPLCSRLVLLRCPGPLLSGANSSYGM